MAASASVGAQNGVYALYSGFGAPHRATALWKYSPRMPSDAMSSSSSTAHRAEAYTSLVPSWPSQDTELASSMIGGIFSGLAASTRICPRVRILSWNPDDSRSAMLTGPLRAQAG